MVIMAVVSALKADIIEKLDTLPEPALREVLDFMNFLAWKGTGTESSLLAAAGQLSGEPVSAQAIEEELYGRGPG
jgi:hypothetical protein